MKDEDIKEDLRLYNLDISFRMLEIQNKLRSYSANTKSTEVYSYKRLLTKLAHLSMHLDKTIASISILLSKD